MQTNGHRAPSCALDAFWVQADVEACGDHPLARELCFHLEALERYRAMIADAHTAGRDDLADSLVPQYDRQAKVVSDLKEALRRATSSASPEQPS